MVLKVLKNINTNDTKFSLVIDLQSEKQIIREPLKYNSLANIINNLCNFNDHFYSSSSSGSGPLSPVSHIDL